MIQPTLWTVSTDAKWDRSALCLLILCKLKSCEQNRSPVYASKLEYGFIMTTPIILEYLYIRNQLNFKEHLRGRHLGTACGGGGGGTACSGLG
jgi:hypothetical protein